VAATARSGCARLDSDCRRLAVPWRLHLALRANVRPLRAHRPAPGAEKLVCYKRGVVLLPAEIWPVDAAIWGRRRLREASCGHDEPHSRLRALEGGLARALPAHALPAPAGCGSTSWPAGLHVPSSDSLSGFTQLLGRTTHGGKRSRGSRCLQARRVEGKAAVER